MVVYAAGTLGTSGGRKRITKRSADGNIHIAMSALCGAEKIACERLMGEFEQLNDGMRRVVQRQLQQGGRK